MRGKIKSIFVALFGFLVTMLLEFIFRYSKSEFELGLTGPENAVIAALLLFPFLYGVHIATDIWMGKKQD